jgi:hypothetical protein
MYTVQLQNYTTVLHAYDDRWPPVGHGIQLRLRIRMQ